MKIPLFESAMNSAFLICLLQMLKYHHKQLCFLKMERKKNALVLSCVAFNPQTRKGNTHLALPSNCQLKVLLKINSSEIKI